MNCPKCKGKLEVMDSRERDDGVIYRRRWCSKCGAKYSTRETITDYEFVREYDRQLKKLLKSVQIIKGLEVSRLYGRESTDMGESDADAQ